MMRLAILAFLFLAACGFGGGGGGGGEVSRKASSPAGGICGVPGLEGVRIDPIAGDPHPGCGISRPVRVLSVAGVNLSQGAILNCKTARALNTWVTEEAKPAFAGLGGLERLRVAAHYSCRTRNHQRGAKVSEHGKGNAIDISAFTMRDGTTYTVLSDWGRGRAGDALSRIRRAACGSFGVVLGPGSDRWHEDHFHFDTSHLGNRFCN